MSDNILKDVQKEVIRIRDMITETTALLPNVRGNFIIYETILNQADSAIREHDTTALIKLLPKLQTM